MWLSQCSPGLIRQRLTDWSERRAKATVDNEKDRAKHPVPAAIRDTHLLYPWLTWRDKENLAAIWSVQLPLLAARRAALAKQNAEVTLQRWDMRHGLPAGWEAADGHLVSHPAGELGIGVSEEDAVLSILPAGLFTSERSAFEQASLTFPDLNIPEGAMAIRWAGAGSAMARIAPENFPMAGILYTQWDSQTEGTSDWVNRGTDFFKQRRGYFHLTTRQTATATVPKRNLSKRPQRPVGAATRGSWFSVSEVCLLKSPKAPSSPGSFLSPRSSP
jgi:hypothetical protein